MQGVFVLRGEAVKIPGTYPYPGPPEIVVGLDEQQLLGMLELWHSWLGEEGRELDENLWARYVHGRISGGNFLPVMAWHGTIAVGMVEVGLHMDPFTSQLTGFGDHLYVLPEYRKMGVFQGLYDACEALMWFYDVDATVLPVQASSASILVPFYEKHGYVKSGYVMRREL